jgi:hypothetical protein
MPKLGLGLSLPQTRVAGGFTPKKLSGLSLWLKADAGVTETPETFISQVVINGADNTPTSNGTYTRASGGETQFNGPNGNYIDWDGSNWSVNDSEVGEKTYYNNTFNFSGTWADLYGTLPVPTSITSTTPTGNELVTTWADQSGNNNNFSGGATFEGNYINGKPAIYFNGTNSYLDSPSTLLDNFSEISLFGVWSIAPGQSNKGVFGTSNYSNLEISTNPDVTVRIRNGDYSETFISSGFSNVGEWTISYLDAENESGVAYKNGQELIAVPAAVQMPLASGVTYSLGRYAYPSFSGLNAEMYLAEFIIYNRRLTTQERQQVEAYLSNKYAIQLPNISNMFLPQLWLKADAGVTLDGSNVTAWADQSGNGNNFTPASGTVIKSNNIIGANPAVLFNGGSLSGNDIVTAKTIYAVIKTLAASAQQYAAILEVTGGSLYSAISGTAWGSYYGVESSSGQTIPTETASIIATLSDDGINYELRRDGQQVVSSTGSGFTSRSAAYLGSDSSASQSANVYISEIVVYDRVLTTPERQQVEAYLNTKYQIYPWRILISGAGTTTSNGEYVWDGSEVDGNGFPIYRKTSNANSIIAWEVGGGPNETGTWNLFDADYDDTSYTIESFNFSGTWLVINGASPAPTSTLYYTP